MVEGEELFVPIVAMLLFAYAAVEYVLARWERLRARSARSGRVEVAVRLLLCGDVCIVLLWDLVAVVTLLFATVPVRGLFPAASTCCVDALRWRVALTAELDGRLTWFCDCP